MTKAARMVAGHSIAAAGKASAGGPELARGEEVVEVDGVLYRQRKGHTPLYDERGRMVDWVWTHMELWPLQEERTRAEKEKEARAEGETTREERLTPSARIAREKKACRTSAGFRKK